MKKTNIKLRATRPNHGLEVLYRKRLLAFFDQMHRSVAFNILRAYKNHAPVMASDELPAAFAMAIMERLAKKWLARLDDYAERLADFFVRKAQKNSDASMVASLTPHDFAVQFKMTRAMQDVFRSSVEQNVSLIKSIGSEHFGKIEQLVMRSVSEGRDMFTLAEELRKRYDITKSRARLIARDQNNKMTAVFARVRQQELGCTKAIWHHSHGGHRPRPSHVKFDGHEYDIEKGAYIDGKYIWPGTEINCRCYSQPIIPRF